MAKVKEAEISEKTLWIGGGILLAVVVVFVMGRVSGKKDDQDPSDINPNVQPIKVTTNNGSFDWNPSAMVKRVHTAFVVNWFMDRHKVLEDLSNLQDIQVKAVADAYQQMYGSTLRKTLNDVWVSGNRSAYLKIIERMDLLEIP